MKNESRTGAGWLNSNGKEMSEFGENVADFLGILYSGIYHMDTGLLCKTDFTGEKYIETTVSDMRGRFSTYDDSLLTHIVILAHDRNIRVGIEAATHGYLKLTFMRVTRSGFYADKHPSLAENVERLRK